MLRNKVEGSFLPSPSIDEDCLDKGKKFGLGVHPVCRTFQLIKNLFHVVFRSMNCSGDCMTRSWSMKNLESLGFQIQRYLLLRKLRLFGSPKSWISFNAFVSHVTRKKYIQPIRSFYSIVVKNCLCIKISSCFLEILIVHCY